MANKWRNSGHSGGLVTKSCPTLAIPWTVACQAPLSMGFSRQEYWRRLPFHSPGDLPDLGIKPACPVSPAWQADSLLLKSLGKPKISRNGSSESHSVVSNSCNPMDCSLQGSSVHGILQARILKWLAISFSRGIFPTQ